MNKDKKTKAPIALAALMAGGAALAMPPATSAEDHAHHGHAMHQEQGMVDHSAHMAAAQKQAVTRSTALYAVPDVAMVGMKGEKISLHEALGEGPVMVNFIYTTCTTVCPAMSATFSEVQRNLAGGEGRLRLVSISIDPEHDTPARLRDYAKMHRAGADWTFLTGTVEDSVAVQRAFDVYRGNKMNHAPVTLLRASADGEWIRMEGFASAGQLVAEIERFSAHHLSQR